MVPKNLNFFYFRVIFFLFWKVWPPIIIRRARRRRPPAAALIIRRRRRRVNYYIENHLRKYIAFQAVLIFQPIKFEFYYNCLDNSSFTSEFILYIHFKYPTALYIHKFKNNLKGRSSVGRVVHRRVLLA